ncbi:hypothetical protein D3C73_1054400 [compost metagenome]
MENQHRKIKGYRELNETEISLMNEIKAKGVELGELVTKINDYLAKQRNDNAVAYINAEEGSEAFEEMARLKVAETARWASIGKTDLQTGLMALTRSIAQPGFF